MAKTKTGNPFLDNPFLDGDFAKVADFSKFAEQFKLPGFDATALVEAQKRNIEAVTAVNRIAFEGAQAMLTRQAEILRMAMTETPKAVQTLITEGTPEDKLTKQAELVKEAYETALTNLNELAELSAKSNREAGKVMTDRIAESFSEFQVAVKQTAVKQTAVAK